MARADLKTELFQFTCPADLKEWVRQYALSEGLSMANVVVLALREKKRQDDIEEAEFARKMRGETIGTI